MNSNKKVIFNYRLAQSKEKWETDFLSKIKNSNDLLYLAAVKSNKYNAGPVNDKSYYTSDNKQKILDALDSIISNPYNQRWHSDFQNWESGAKKQLDKMVGENSEIPTDTSSNPTEFGSGASTTRPGITTPSVAPSIATGTFDESPEDTENDQKASKEAKDIVAKIKTLMASAKSDERSFLTNYYTERQPILQEIDNKKQFLFSNQNDMISINRWMDKLNNLYMKLLKPEGVHKKGNSYFVTDHYRAFRDLKNALLYHNLYESKKVKDIVEVIQSQFLNENPGNMDIAGIDGSKIAEFNIMINQYNAKWKTSIPRLVWFPE